MIVHSTSSILLSDTPFQGCKNYESTPSLTSLPDICYISASDTSTKKLLRILTTLIGVLVSALVKGPVVNTKILKNVGP
jgi:hypothetical protein